MKRYGIFGVLVLIVTLMTALMAGAAVIKGSKHDLSFVTGTGPYKSADLASGGTSQICVFCHTPHGGNTNAPLWNRANPTSVYTPYASDVMSALSYTGASSLGTGALHAKTRICLSCHDGTIAMGSLVNLPQGLTAGTSIIPIQGLVDGKMPTTATGYIGINLSDDHPVAIKYVNLDPELRIPPSPTITPGPGGPVRLYTNAGTDYVECTSCHNPHDNQYGNFLVGSNTQSGICISCHNKTGFATSIHGTPNTLFPYAPPTGGNPVTLGANVGEVKCMNCHFPHKAGVLDTNKTNPVPTQGKYLLSFNEEQSCFNTNNDRWNTSPSANTVCHGADASVARRRIQPEVVKTYAHKVTTYSGVHQATEGNAGKGWINAGGSLTRWHVECADCHNPHTANNVNHTPPTNAVGNTSPLYGAAGVDVTTWPTWASPTTGSYTYIKGVGVTVAAAGVTAEYQICFKCHSDFAWQDGTINTVPDSPSLGVGNKMTNQAMEFNPGNASYHPIGGVTNRNLTGVTFRAPWHANRGNQTMYCSDCHGNNLSTPQGPHGSTNNAILRSLYTNTYSTTISAQQPTGELCSQCHDDLIYNTANGANTAGTTGFWTGSVNLHNTHATRALVNPPSTYAYRCVNCHTRVPHGYKTTGMIVLRGDGFPYEARATSAGTITVYSPPAGDWGALENANCTTVNGCHQ